MCVRIGILFNDLELTIINFYRLYCTFTDPIKDILSGKSLILSLHKGLLYFLLSYESRTWKCEVLLPFQNTYSKKLTIL